MHKIPVKLVTGGMPFAFFKKKKISFSHSQQRYTPNSDYKKNQKHFL